MSFSEAFEHHIDFVYMRCAGLVSQHITQRDEWRAYVRGYEPHATFPHAYTVDRIAVCIGELQREEFMIRMARKRAQFKGNPCIGLQLDMWTDTETHTAFAAISLAQPSRNRPRT